MPTKRQWTTALCTGTTLIVAGGMGVDTVLSIVEVMNTESHQWSTAADLPEPMYLELLIYQLHILFVNPFMVIGGLEDSGKATTAVYMYSSTTNSWEIISHMITGRCECFTAVLPDNRLMVVGGTITGVTKTDAVELASVC